jgi:LPS-assembly lipoprotein
MSSRRAALLGLLGTALPGLGGCGFRPLLAEANAQNVAVAHELAAIQVQGLQDSRLSQLVRNGLEDELNPTSISAPDRYQLKLRLWRRTQALGVQLNSTITRYNLTLIARFTLLDPGDGRLLYGSTVRRVASYNVSREPYADLVSEEDAERRAARELSVDIRNLLAVHFARGDEAA